MGKSAYIGVANVARKVKQPYVGVGGVAHKVKKGYIGVGGVARQFYTGYEQLVNYTMFYDYGNECTGVTGGWVEHRGTYNSKYYCANFYTTNKINPANYSCLAVRYNYSAGESSLKGHCYIDNAQGGLGDDKRNLPSAKASAKNEILVLSTSGMSEGYLKVGVDNGNSSTATATKNSNHLYTHVYQSGTYQYTMSTYVIALFKADDWATLCSIAGVTAPASVSALVNDSAKLATIFGNSGAVEYMALCCTGDFMAYAVASSTFITALNASANKAMITGNTHWAKFLAMRP